MNSKIQKIIFEAVSNNLGIEINTITPEDSFFDDYNADELEVSDLVNKICQELKIDPTLCDIQELETVADLIEFCEHNSDEL